MILAPATCVVYFGQARSPPVRARAIEASNVKTRMRPTFRMVHLLPEIRRQRDERTDRGQCPVPRTRGTIWPLLPTGKMDN